MFSPLTKKNITERNAESENEKLENKKTNKHTHITAPQDIKQLEIIGIITKIFFNFLRRFLSDMVFQRIKTFRQGDST